MSSPRIVFVVNPNAGNGVTGREWPRIWAKARDRLGSFETRMTSRPHDAIRLTRGAVASGAETVVCVGGDGTLNEVINGLMDDHEPIPPAVRLGYLPRGTGCDLCRSLTIPRDLHKAFDNILNGRSRPMDIGRMTYREHTGQRTARYFHNVLSFGLGGEVDDRVNRTTKALGGFVSFVWATLLSILLYEKKRIYLQVDDQFEGEITTWNIAVANGQYHGGGMWVAPGAALDDGLFQVTVIGDLHLSEVFQHLPKLYTGKIYEVSKIKKLAGRRLIATSSEPVLIDMDGEQPGRLPVAVEIVPSALEILSN